MDKYQETKNRYLREQVETATIRFKKGDKKRIQAFAKEQGKSLNQFILDLIAKEMSEK